MAIKRGLECPESQHTGLDPSGSDGAARLQVCRGGNVMVGHCRHCRAVMTGAARIRPPGASNIGHPNTSLRIYALVHQ